MVMDEESSMISLARSTVFVDQVLSGWLCRGRKVAI